MSSRTFTFLLVLGLIEETTEIGKFEHNFLLLFVNDTSSSSREVALWISLPAFLLQLLGSLAVLLLTFLNPLGVLNLSYFLISVNIIQYQLNLHFPTCRFSHRSCGHAWMSDFVQLRNWISSQTWKDVRTYQQEYQFLKALQLSFVFWKTLR